MKKIMDLIKKNKKTSIITGAVVLIVILFVLFQTNVINFGQVASNNDNQAANLIEADILDELTNQANVENGGESEEMGDNNGNSNQGYQVVDGLAYFNTVRVPVLSNQKIFDYDGPVQGCEDKIMWINVPVEPTPAPLTTGIEKLFGSEVETVFEPGNFLATQKNLGLDDVIVGNGLARIYLTGEFSAETVCDAPRQFIQLEAVALQYDSVSNIEIYLNNQRIN